MIATAHVSFVFSSEILLRGSKNIVNLNILIESSHSSSDPVKEEAIK